MPRATRSGAVLRKILADWLHQGELLVERRRGGGGKTYDEDAGNMLVECVDMDDCIRWIILD